MDSQNGRNLPEQPGPADAALAPKKRRFQIVKLEDRIAPDKGGKGTHNCSGSGSPSTTTTEYCSSIY